MGDTVKAAQHTLRSRYDGQNPWVCKFDELDVRFVDLFDCGLGLADDFTVDCANDDNWHDVGSFCGFGLVRLELKAVLGLSCAVLWQSCAWCFVCLPETPEVLEGTATLAQ